jgi:pimeloyl-ACP methyl ester carboxylesterase
MVSGQSNIDALIAFGGTFEATFPVDVTIDQSCAASTGGLGGATLGLAINAPGTEQNVYCCSVGLGGAAFAASNLNANYLLAYDYPSTVLVTENELQIMGSEYLIGDDGNYHPLTAQIDVTFMLVEGPSITTTQLPDAQTANAYGPVSLAATGGTAPYTWSATGLPPGFTISGSSLSSTGNPPAPAQTYSVTLTVKDANGLTAGTTLSLVVNPLIFTFLDPNPCGSAFPNCPGGGAVLLPPYGGDPSGLISQGRAVQGVAADGVTQVILWAPASAPLIFSLSTGDGTMTAPGSNNFSTSGVSVGPVNAGASGSVAMAVYQAPIDFVRAGNSNDATATQRSVTINVLASDGVTVLQSPISITLVRPPVVLVHGFTSEPKYWLQFTPMITDPRFAVTLADYSQHVTGVTGINPGYANRGVVPPPVLPANVLGLDYNAPGVFLYFEQALASYRCCSSPLGAPVAATQVDVVAHSMGGLITRDMPYVVQAGPQTPAGFFSPENYGQGIVHKLITIGTPHLGAHSPLPPWTCEISVAG